LFNLFLSLEVFEPKNSQKGGTLPLSPRLSRHQTPLFEQKNFEGLKKFLKIMKIAEYYKINESLNCVIKGLNDWKEYPIDAMVLSLFQLSQYCIMLRSYADTTTTANTESFLHIVTI
jgi:hypothetical protein